MSRDVCHQYIAKGPLCPNRPIWRITTAAGQSLFCAEHAKFYLDRGPSEYPAERLPEPPR